MAYVRPNFTSKKALKEAVKNHEEVRVFSPGPFPVKENGREFIEGPWYPAPHSWYAEVEVEDGQVVRVK